MSDDFQLESMRAGFGRGLKLAGSRDENVVALCADLTDSINMNLFKDEFPDRFIEVGIAEQNLVTIASGMAAMGKIPFTGSYAAFSPGRNWEQIRTTICLNNQPVKIIGSHAGISTGADGATHQMLEDIALMRVLPNMTVVLPGDSYEAKQFTLAIAGNNKPSYLRLARSNTPVFLENYYKKLDRKIGESLVLREGHDLTIFSTGIMTYQCLEAADILAQNNIHVEVIHIPVIKPLDDHTVLNSARKTGRVITVEEAQIAGGFGSAVAELLSEMLPTPLLRLGINDRFGESGTPDELLDHFGLTSSHISAKTQEFISKHDRYHQW
jgi:transketolase